MKPMYFADSAFIARETIPALGKETELAARARIQLCYLWRHRRLANLDRPVRFTEWVQWRKLNDRDPRKPLLVDKVRVKHHVAATLGEDWVIPTIFYGTELPCNPPWAKPLVVKARHGCNQYAFVRDEHDDWDAIATRAQRWTRGPYGLWLDEWAYRDVPLGVIVEPFIGEGGEAPADYKIHVFGGRAMCIQVDVGRERTHRRAFFDIEWNPLSTSSGWTSCPPPQSMRAMLDAAETLGRNFDFVRCDFYEVGGRPRFGEMSFYPASGLRPLGDRFDYWLGNLWSQARTTSRHRAGMECDQGD